MFNLIYRDGTRENAGHYETLDKASAEMAFECGQAVTLTSGVASKATPTGAVYGIVAADSPEGESTVVVLKVEKDMIFSAPTTVAPKDLVKGDKVAISADDPGKLGAESTTGAATVVDTCGATEIGDRIEVRFE